MGIGASIRMRQPLRLDPYAVLVVDMIGYSQRLAEHPLGTHSAFKSHLQDVFAPCVHEHAGRIIKTTGDGIVAIFRDTNLAERCGREMQRQVTIQEDERDSFAPIQYRIAIHFGEVGVEQHDIFGLDVNIAIHMQRLAPPGGVCLSGASFAQLPEQSRGRYRYQKKTYLKNIPDPVAIYSQEFPSARASQQDLDVQPPIPRRSYLTPPPSLAVAVFSTFAEIASRQVLTQIVQDSLIHGLSRFREVFGLTLVDSELPRVAAEGFRSRAFLLNEMACQYLVHGSCAIGARTLVMTAHLESLSKGELIWSSKLKIDLEHQLEQIDHLVATEVVAPIVLFVDRAEASSWRTGRHSEDEILFREAKALVEQRTRASVERGRALLLEILGRCGEVGDVYISLARAEQSRAFLCPDEQFVESVQCAWEFAKKAVELDDLNPHAHSELAMQEMFLKRQSDAEEIYRYALKLNPYDPMLRADWADCLVNTGRAREAVAILEEVLSGWPRDRAWVQWNLADAYWALDRPDRIVALLGRHPDQHHVHRYLAASYAKLGQLDMAGRHADKVRQLQPGFSAKTWSRIVPFATPERSEEYVGFLERAGL